jgi:hypothetical protein
MTSEQRYMRKLNRETMERRWTDSYVVNGAIIFAVLSAIAALVMSVG